MTVVGASEDEVPVHVLRADAPVVGAEGRWWVQLVFHQRSASAPRDSEAFALVDTVMRENLDVPPLPPGATLPDLSPPDHRETVVQVTTPLETDDEEGLQQAVARGLDALRDADRAAIIALGEVRSPLAPADVWPMVPSVRRSDADDSRIVSGPRMIVLENNTRRHPVAPPEMDQEATDRVESALSAIQARHPFLRWREWLTSAHEARVLTRPEDAIVRLAIAQEVMLDAVLGLALWETGRPPAEASEIFASSLSRRLTRTLPDLLGGAWDRSRGALGEWNSDLAYLRGRVVHRGHRPDPSETEAAFRAAERLHEHVVTRVTARRSRFPHAAWLLVGPKELERRQAWDGAVRALGDGETLADDDWLLAYDRWRAEVDRLVRDT